MKRLGEVNKNRREMSHRNGEKKAKHWKESVAMSGCAAQLQTIT